MSLVKVLCACLALPLLFACEDKVAGGYDDVENPAITVALTDGVAPGAGEVAVYARHQSPLDNPLPLLTAASDADGMVVWHDTDIVKAMALAQTQGIPWPHPDTIAFNLTGQNAGSEAFQIDVELIRLSPTAYRFQRRDGTLIVTAGPKGKLPVTLPLKPAILNFAGKVGAAGEGLRLHSVFVSGSPYAAAVNADGGFTLPRLAAGSYELKAKSQEGKIYTSENALNTDSAFTAENWFEAEVIWIEP